MEEKTPAGQFIATSAQSSSSSKMTARRRTARTARRTHTHIDGLRTVPGCYLCLAMMLPKNMQANFSTELVAQTHSGVLSFRGPGISAARPMSPLLPLACSWSWRAWGKLGHWCWVGRTTIGYQAIKTGTWRAIYGREGRRPPHGPWA